MSQRTDKEKASLIKAKQSTTINAQNLHFFLVILKINHIHSVQPIAKFTFSKVTFFTQKERNETSANHNENFFHLNINSIII